MLLWRGIPENNSVGQRAGICGEGTTEVAEQSGYGHALIEPGSPWENSYCESFNGKLRDECLNGEIFYSLKEAQIVIERWRVEYNTNSPTTLSALGYRPPVPLGP